MTFENNHSNQQIFLYYFQYIFQDIYSKVIFGNIIHYFYFIVYNFYILAELFKFFKNNFSSSIKNF